MRLFQTVTFIYGTLEGRIASVLSISWLESRPQCDSEVRHRTHTLLNYFHNPDHRNLPTCARGRIIPVPEHDVAHLLRG